MGFKCGSVHTCLLQDILDLSLGCHQLMWLYVGEELGFLGTGSCEGLPARAGTDTLPGQPSDIDRKNTGRALVTGDRDLRPTY